MSAQLFLDNAASAVCAQNKRSVCTNHNERRKKSIDERTAEQCKDQNQTVDLDEQRQLVFVYGYVVSIIYQKPGSKWAIVRVRIEDQIQWAKGELLPIEKGLLYQFGGWWEEDPKWGKGLRARFRREVIPASDRELCDYLVALRIPHLSEDLCQKIAQRWGLQGLQIIEDEAEKLAILGLSLDQCQKIQRHWQRRLPSRSLLAAPDIWGLNHQQAQGLFECYGGKTLALLRRDPYAVLQHVGAEFELADQIAERVGIERQDPRRSRAALQSILMRAANQEGNTALPRSELLARTLSRKLQLTGECSEMALAQLLQDDLLSAVPHSDYIGLSSLISAEKTVASRLLEFANYPIKRDILTPPQNLLPEQAAAVMAAQQNRFMILTGSPGTGKTFTLRSILACGWEKPLLAAPTGKAANRLSELTGLPAYTLHRLLEYRPSQDGLHRCSERTLDADLVIVDEAAMLDIPLAAALLQSIDPKQTSLLLSGDADQLPSVGPGNLLRDLIDSQRFQVTRLTQIVRQDQHSQIIPNAQRIIQGNPIRVDNQTYLDFKFFAIDDSTQLLEQRDIADTLCRLFDHLLELGYNSRDIQVLTPMKKGGIPGAYELNTLLQQKLNPSTQARVWQAHKQQFRLLDRVIQLRNDYERGIFNGDTGIIAQIDESHLHVQFDDRVVQYDESNISQLELAYAISIHKSQGSEWPVVILPMSLGHKQMLTRRLFYTALTRARTLFMLIASPRAVAHAIAHNDDNDRITSLPSWLAQASGM